MFQKFYTIQNNININWFNNKMSSNTVIVGWKDVYFCERPEYAFFKLKEEINGQVKESRPAD
jgi:hypothetical protein